MDPGEDGRLPLFGGVRESVERGPPGALTHSPQTLGSKNGGDRSQVGAGEYSPLGRGESLADSVLKLIQGLAESDQVTLDCGGEQAEQDKPAKPIRQGVGGWGEVGEGSDLACPVETGLRAGDDDQGRPVVREFDPGQERRDPLGPTPATVDDQAPKGESMEPDPRSESPPGQPGQIDRGWIREPGEGGQEPGDPETELRSHAEPQMLRRGPADLQADGADGETPARQSPGDPFGHVENSFRERSLGPPNISRLGHQFQPGGVDHQADPAELPGRSRTPREQAEM